MDGLLVIDKPGGITSHDVVNRLRRITGERSIGHLGTLDPMATGVLPLLLGKFTRLAQYFISAEKSYTGTIRFGFATDTYDADGEVAGPRMEPALTLEQVRAAGLCFHGDIDQMPPPFSAKKIGGTPAYKMARAGKPVELKVARVRISLFRHCGAGGLGSGVCHEHQRGRLRALRCSRNGPEAWLWRTSQQFAANEGRRVHAGGRPCF